MPCFPRIVEALNQPADAGAAFDVAFDGAVAFAVAWLEGVAAGHRRVVAAKNAEIQKLRLKVKAYEESSQYLSQPA